MWEGAGCWKNSEKVSMGEVGELLLFSRSVVSNSFETPWTAVCQGPLSMGCSRQEYWSGLSFPSPGDLSDPGIEPTSPDSLPLSHLGSLLAAAGAKSLPSIMASLAAQLVKNLPATQETQETWV